MFELELVKSVSVAEYDLTNFDEICRLFEDNNKGLKALGVGKKLSSSKEKHLTFYGMVKSLMLNTADSGMQ